MAETSIKSWALGILGTVAAGIIVVWLQQPGSPLHHDAALSGTIESVALDSGSPCCTFTVKVASEGYQGKTFDLRALIINADTGAEDDAGVVGTLAPEAAKDEGAGAFVVTISGRGDYVVRFVLTAPNGTELDRADSKTIQVS